MHASVMHTLACCCAAHRSAGCRWACGRHFEDLRTTGAAQPPSGAGIVCENLFLDLGNADGLVQPSFAMPESSAIYYASRLSRAVGLSDAQRLMRCPGDTCFFTYARSLVL